MNFIIIDPTYKIVEKVNAKDVTSLYDKVGLKIGQVDFAAISRLPGGGTVNIIVFEFGLHKPPEEGHYFSIGRQLFEGGAVLFAADTEGETISWSFTLPPVMFYRSHEEVETAIKRNEIVRPRMTVNNEIMWQWGAQP